MYLVHHPLLLFGTVIPISVMLFATITRLFFVWMMHRHDWDWDLEPWLPAIISVLWPATLPLYFFTFGLCGPFIRMFGFLEEGLKQIAMARQRRISEN